MKSVTHTQTFRMDRPAADLFPLFSPEGEKKWVPGWDYENLTGTTGLSEDDVFLTRTHDHAATEAIWIVKAYEPDAYRVQYYKIEPEDKVGVITVTCIEDGPAKARVSVTYTYKALSESGERFISEFDAAAYAAFIDEWQTLLSTYFAAR